MKRITITKVYSWVWSKYWTTSELQILEIMIEISGNNGDRSGSTSACYYTIWCTLLSLKAAQTYKQKQVMLKLWTECILILNVDNHILSRINSRCSCNEKPSTAGWNQDYFYPHFIQELFQKSSVMQYTPSTLNAIQFAQHTLACLL